MAKNKHRLFSKVSSAIGLVFWVFAPNLTLAQALVQGTTTPLVREPATNSRPSVIINTADPAIPTAQEILLDIASPFHWSRYQRGDLNGYRYVLFPDGSANVMQASGLRSILFQLNCISGVSCQITHADQNMTNVLALGKPRPTLPLAPDGEALAIYLAEWVLAGTGAPIEPAPVVVAPPVEIPAEPIAQPEPSALIGELEPNAAVEFSTETAKTPTVAKVKSAPAKPVSVLPARATAPAGLNQQPVNAPVKPIVFSHATSTPIAKAVRKQEDHINKLTKAPEKKNIFQRINLACSITGSVSLRYKHHSSGAERLGKPRVSLGCGAKLSKKLSLQLSVIGYLDKNQKSPSDADFSYALTYRATDKFTFSYSNYSARFGSSNSRFIDSLTSGNLRASYKLPKISLPFDKTANCSTSIGLPEIKDASINLSCGIAVTKKFRISGTAYFYFPGEQSTTEPDFSYTASYRISDDWVASYNNYANNRFPWNRGPKSGLGILGGSLSLSYKFKF